MFEIVEKIITLNGEAPIAGEPIFLIRLSNCNLSCNYCDTNYNEEINYNNSISNLEKEIKQQITAYPGLKVLFTGGEPLHANKQSNVLALIKKMPAFNFYIETNGSVVIDDFSLKNSHFIVDWKTPSSGHGESFVFANLAKLRPQNDCIKFVVSNNDLLWVKDKIIKIRIDNPALPIYLSPQWGKIELEKLAEFIIKNKLSVNLSLQLHKIIWGKDRRGV